MSAKAADGLEMPFAIPVGTGFTGFLTAFQQRMCIRTKASLSLEVTTGTVLW